MNGLRSCAPGDFMTSAVTAIFRPSTTCSPSCRPERISVMSPSEAPVETAVGRKVCPSSTQTAPDAGAPAGTPEILKPNLEMSPGSGANRRALDGTAHTFCLSRVYIVTLAVRPGFSFSSGR